MTAGYTQSGWLVENLDGAQSSFEIVVPRPRPYRGLLHIGYDHILPFASPEIWTARDPIRSSAFRGPFYGAACIVSGYGNLEVVVAQIDGLLAHFWRNGIYGWRGPTFLPGYAVGPPAFIQSRFGLFGNFEVVVPRQGGGLSHFWRENDNTVAWHEASQPYRGGSWSGVGLIHSSEGNLELVGVMDADLVCMFQQGIGGVWVGPLRIAEGFAGRPALLQGCSSPSVTVVAARTAGGLACYCRDISYGYVWEDVGRVPERGKATNTMCDDVTMIRSSAGWLEVIAKGVPSEDNFDVHLKHYRGAGGDVWDGPNCVLLSSEDS